MDFYYHRKKTDKYAIFANQQNRRNAMVRRIPTEEITKHVKEMCIEANHYLSKDMEGALAAAEAKEQSPLGRKILCQLQENLQVASCAQAVDMIY